MPDYKVADLKLAKWGRDEITLAEKERFSGHAKSLYHNSDKHGQPVYISKNTQLMFCLLFRQVHHMLVNKAAQHIIHHTTHAHDHQWISVLHDFFPKGSVETKLYLCKFFPKNEESENAAGKVADQVVTHTDVFIIKSA